MELISYEKFSSLSLDMFFPASNIRDIGPNVECAIGFGSGQSYGFTALFWPDDLVGVVGELQLDMRTGECPQETAERILFAIGLAISPGDSGEKILRLLGLPEYSDGESTDECFHRFIVGIEYPYIIGCHFDKDFRLNGLMVVRKDMWPESQ